MQHERAQRPLDIQRSSALSNLRLCITVLVVLHHSILAYCQFAAFDPLHYLWSSAPIVDAHRWLGFDIVAGFNDTYFMALMFLVSGLFVLPSLNRHGVRGHVARRCVRLGLPFLACVTVIMPLAYYPSYLQTGAQVSLFQYWGGYFASYGWPGGPAWFLWFLLALDLVASVIFLFWPAVADRAKAVPDWLVERPMLGFGLFLAAVAASYLPLREAFGATHWFSWKPFAVQASRIGLYALFFGGGMAFGSAGIWHPLFAREGLLARGWIACGIAALMDFGALVFLKLEAAHGVAPWASPAWEALDGWLFAGCCALAAIALPGLFLRHARGHRRWSDALAGCAYGIYLVHYAVLTWVQTGLLRVALPGVVKGCLAFSATLLLSWGLVALLKRSKPLQHILQ